MKSSAFLPKSQISSVFSIDPFQRPICHLPKKIMYFLPTILKFKSVSSIASIDQLCHQYEHWLGEYKTKRKCK